MIVCITVGSIRVLSIELASSMQHADCRTLHAESIAQARCLRFDLGVRGRRRQSSNPNPVNHAIGHLLDNELDAIDL